MNASQSRFVVRVFFCCGLAAASLSGFGALPDASAQSTVSAQKHASSVNRVTFMGTHLLTKASSGGTLAPGFLISQGNDANVGFEIPGVSGNNSPARERAAGVPTPAGIPFGTGAFFPLPGLTQFDQAVAFTGQANGSNGQLEPPDQGLAVGNGF